MADLTVDTKIILFLYTGPTMSFSATNTPWQSNVLKIIRPSAGPGLNTRQAFNGSFSGTAGGAVTQLVNGTIYELTAGVYNGWTLPNATRIVVDAAQASTRLLATFPAGAANTVPMFITLAEQAGTYNLSGSTNLSTISYQKNGTTATLPITVAIGDTIQVTGTASSSGVGTLTLIKQ